MTYKCLDCGHIFEEGEEGHRFVEVEYWGAPYSQKISCCPICKGDYKETVSCKICGSAHLPKELTEGVCDECISSYENDIDTCYQVGKNEKVEIKINGFLATMFESAAIEEILYNYLIERSKTEKVDCSEYINEDFDWFVREVNKYECEKRPCQCAK